MSRPVLSEDGLPIYTVPQQRIVSIEHPCIVANLDNALKSLGGEQQLKDVSEARHPHSSLNVVVLTSP